MESRPLFDFVTWKIQYNPRHPRRLLPSYYPTDCTARRSGSFADDKADQGHVIHSSLLVECRSMQNGNNSSPSSLSIFKSYRVGNDLSFVEHKEKKERRVITVLSYYIFINKVSKGSMRIIELPRYWLHAGNQLSWHGLASGTKNRKRLVGYQSNQLLLNNW